MLRLAAWRWCCRPLSLVFLLLSTWLWSGCSPDAFLVSEEDRDRNFRKALDAERAGDFEGAAEFYERAIEKNPRSAVANFNYAALCESRLKRYPDAVHYYQRYLKIRPEDPKAEDIRRRITSCTERIASSVPLLIRSETIARDLEAMRNENTTLRGQITNLVGQVSQWSNEWRRTSIQLQTLASAPATPTPSYAGGTVGGDTSGTTSRERPGTRPTPGATSSGSTSPSGATTRYPSSSNPSSSSSSSGYTSGGMRPYSTYARPGAVRTHRVQPGETMKQIAARYGVSLGTLQAANPQVEARRMRAGAILRIPER